MFYIDGDKCIGCGACANVCSQEAISIENGIAVTNQALCRECGNCAATCPADAIYAIAPIYVASGKGGDIMRERGWFGWGRGRGLGRGNPYPFCRFYPWLPRRWWAYGPGAYPQVTPAYYPTQRPYRWW